MKAHKRFCKRPEKSEQADVDVTAVFAPAGEGESLARVRLKFYGDDGELWIDLSAVEAVAMIHMISGRLQRNLTLVIR